MIVLSGFSDEASSDLKRQIEALRRNHIGYTELRSIGGKNVSEFSESECKSYAKELSDGGIKVWAIGSPLGKTEISVNFVGYLETVKRVCGMANILGTDKVRVFSFFNAYEEKERVFEYLNEMAETAERFGVTLYHENEKEIYGDRSERVLEIMENVKKLKYVYDPANYLQVGEEADKTLSLLHKKTDYFHIKDLSATGELVPAGCGEGKIDKLVEMLTGDKVRQVKYGSGRDFVENGHQTDAGDLDMYGIVKALVKNGFEGYVRPDHGRNIWGEDGKPGYGLYDRALGAAYLTGLFEGIEKSEKSREKESEEKRS